jgi:branched-chain amino acid transport system permease protein
LDLFGEFLVDAVLLGGVYTLMAIGLSLSYGVTRIVNFSHGEWIMLGAYGAFWLFRLAGIDPLISVPILFLIATLVGYFLFRFTISKVLRAARENQILLTFGIALVLQNGAIALWSADERAVNPAYAYSSIVVGTIVIPSARLIAFGAGALMVAGLFTWLRYSELGRASRALVDNADSAILVGIDVDRLYALCFGLSVALGAAAGAVFSFIFPITPFLGFGTLVKGFAIIVLGGLGSTVGAVAGAFILAFVETAVAYYVPNGSGWSEAVSFAVLLVVLIFRPRGLLGHAVGD